MENNQPVANSRKDLEVLLVDNDDITCKIHRARWKALFPHQVRQFSDGKEALSYIQNHPELDFLVLLDIGMPVMDGWQFLEEIEKPYLKSRVFVIIATCSVSRADKKKAKGFPSVLIFYEKPLISVHFHTIPQLPRLIPYFVSAN